MTLWATLEYLKNEDVIEISYRKFDQTKGDSQYPAMSLCFVDAYKQSELEKWNNYKVFGVNSPRKMELLQDLWNKLS